MGASSRGFGHCQVYAASALIVAIEGCVLELRAFQRRDFIVCGVSDMAM